jgi:hypothetical protein
MPEFKISFKSNPIPLFPSYRPMYRIAQILLVLHINSNGGKSSLLKLHLFSWAFKSDANLAVLQEYVDSNFNGSRLYFGIEPTLNRALSLAIGEGLIHSDGLRYSITNKGTSLAKDIINDSELFSDLKPALKSIGKRISESKITQLERLWKNA